MNTLQFDCLMWRPKVYLPIIFGMYRFNTSYIYGFTCEYCNFCEFSIMIRQWGSRGPEFESRHSDHKSSVFSENGTFSVYFALGKFHLFEDVFSCGTACGIDDFLMNQRKPKWKDFLSFLEDGFLRRLSSSFSLSIV